MEDYEKKADGDKIFNSHDLCMAFKQMMKKYRDEDYVIDFRAEPAVFNQCFIQKGINGEDALMIIEAYIRFYDLMLKTEEYPAPKIRQLRFDWIIKKTLRALENERRIKEDKKKVESAVILDIVF